MLHVEKEEEGKACAPEKYFHSGNNYEGRNEYRPRGTRIQQIFPKSYLTRDHSNNTRQKSSVRVIYDDPITPDIFKHFNRGKFKRRGRYISPQNNNHTIQIENDDKVIENIVPKHVKECKSLSNSSQPVQKTKYFSKSKGLLLSNKLNLPEGGGLSEQNQTSAVGSPIFSNFQSRGSKTQRRSYNSHSYNNPFVWHRPNLPFNNSQYPYNGAKFNLNGLRFSSSHSSNTFQGPKTTPKVSDSVESSCIIQQFNESSLNKQKTTAKTNYNETKKATKLKKTCLNEIEIETTTKSSSTSSNEPESVNQDSTVSISDGTEVATGVVSGVQAKKKKKQKKKNLVDVNDLIAKAHAIGLVEQKLIRKPIHKNLTVSNDNADTNTNVHKRLLTVQQRLKEILRESQQQLEERFEMEEKEPIKRMPFYYGLTESIYSNNDNEDTMLYSDTLMTGKDRARGGCQRGAYNSNKGGHTQRQIYEFKFAKERIKRNNRT